MSGVIDGVISGLFKYQKPKVTVVDIWHVGFVYRCLQLGVFLFVLISMWFTEAGWAYSERPIGSFNAWGSDNGAATSMMSGKTFEYCNNESYSFVYWEPGWNYGTPPKCRSLTVNEVAVKGLGNVFFTTVYIEKNTWGWTCGDSTDAQSKASCAALRGGVVTEHPNGQCECVEEEAYYATAVEEMAMKMEISYDTSIKMGSLKGSTNVPFGTEDASTGDTDLHVQILDQNDVVLNPTYNSGSAVSLSVAEWLRSAGLTLSDVVTHTDDYRYSADSCEAYNKCGEAMNYPRFRTTGVYVEVYARFHNTEDQVNTIAGRWDAFFNPTNVRVEVKAAANTKIWAGLGAVTHYEQMPSGPNQRTYHKVERYRQGVVFDIRGVGEVIKLDVGTLVTMLVATIALLKFAGVITDWYVSLFVGGAIAQIITNKTKEKVDANGELAEIGMKAAMAALQFGELDPDKGGTIDLIDIAKAFGKIKGVSPRQAYNMAWTVIDYADKDTVKHLTTAQQIQKLFGAKPKVQPADADGMAGLDFAEFITCIEGDAIDFAAYIEKLPGPPTDKVDSAVIDTLKKHWEAKGLSTAEPETSTTKPSLKSKPDATSLSHQAGAVKV